MTIKLRFKIKTYTSRWLSLLPSERFSCNDDPSLVSFIQHFPNSILGSDEMEMNISFPQCTLYKFGKTDLILNEAKILCNNYNSFCLLSEFSEVMDVNYQKLDHFLELKNFYYSFQFKVKLILSINNALL